MPAHAVMVPTAAAGIARLMVKSRNPMVVKAAADGEL